jgi:hypothetical protein
MSKLTNKITTIKKSSDSEEKLDYSFFIIQCINVPPKEGYTVEDMKKRIKISEIAENTKLEEEFDFKAEDLIILKKCVNEMRWAVAHKDIVAFSDDVEKL